MLNDCIVIRTEWQIYELPGHHLHQITRSEWQRDKLLVHSIEFANIMHFIFLSSQFCFHRALKAKRQTFLRSFAFHQICNYYAHFFFKWSPGLKGKNTNFLAAVCISSNFQLQCSIFFTLSPGLKGKATNFRVAVCMTMEMECPSYFL